MSIILSRWIMIPCWKSLIVRFKVYLKNLLQRKFIEIQLLEQIETKPYLK